MLSLRGTLPSPITVACGRRGSSPRSAGWVLRLRGRLLAGLRRTLPAADPTRCSVFRDDRNCPERSDHAWPCLPLDLEEAAATSVFPLGLLAPAACRVPGGLIKFDLFFFFPVKVYHLHLRRLGGLSSVLYGLGESRTASPRVPSCVQSRRRRRGGGVPQLQVCRGRASQAPATLLWPRIYPRSPARAPSLSHPCSRG